MPDVVVVSDPEPTPTPDEPTEVVVVVDEGTPDATLDHEARIVRLEMTVDNLSTRILNAEFQAQDAERAVEEQAEVTEAIAEVVIDMATEPEPEPVVVETPPTTDEPPSSKKHPWWGR